MKRKIPWRSLLIGIVVVAAAVFAWTHFRGHPAPAASGDQTNASGSGRKGAGAAKDAKIPVVVAAATSKDVPVYLDGLGSVQAYNTVTVHTRVDGELVDIAFVEGQDVKAGQVLARLDPRTFQAQLDQVTATKAKDDAQLADARLDLDRYTNLGNRVSGQTLDTQRALVKQLEATVRVDQANIDNARTMLAYCTITSPIDGRTGIRQVDKGNIVHASDANGLVVITQIQPISILFTLPQQDLPAIAAAMQGVDKLTDLAVGTDKKTVLDRGQLELVDNQIDPTTGTIKLKSTFPNPKRTLWPGGFVNVRLLVSTRLNATVVPSVAIQRGPQNSYVYALKSDDTVEMRTVKVGMLADPDAVIDDGVQPGDKIVVDGMARLQNGSAVTTQRPAAEGLSAPLSPTTGLSRAHKQ